MLRFMVFVWFLEVLIAVSRFGSRWFSFFVLCCFVFQLVFFVLFCFLFLSSGFILFVGLVGLGLVGWLVACLLTYIDFFCLWLFCDRICLFLLFLSELILNVHEVHG